MSEEEEKPEEEGEAGEEKAKKKGPKSLDDDKGPPPKCWGGVPKRDSQGLVRVGLPCRTPGTARPTAIFKCMQAKREDHSYHPQQPPSRPGQLAPDARGEDPYPAQGGMLTKTCGVKAQFVGEIIIKKEIPPRKADCTAKTCPNEPGPPYGQGGGAQCPSGSPPPLGGGGRCVSPTHHHQAPICAVPQYPLQPEITDDCRRKLSANGPDSSRYHPDCSCNANRGGDDSYCPSTCSPCYEFQPPERNLNAGEEEKFETIRTREEIADNSCSKYVKVEDTFRRVRSFNPSPDCPPPPLNRCTSARIRPCPEPPPRCAPFCRPPSCPPPCIPCSPCGPCPSPCGPCPSPCGPCPSPCGPCPSPCGPCGPCPPLYVPSACPPSCGPCPQPCSSTPCPPCGPYPPACSSTPCPPPCPPCSPCPSPCPPTYNPPPRCCEKIPINQNRYVDPPCLQDGACPPAWAEKAIYNPSRDGYEPYRCKPPCTNDPMEPSVSEENLRQYMPNAGVQVCNN